MIEQQLYVGGDNGGDGEVIFLWDPSTEKDISTTGGSITYVGTAGPTDSFIIDGQPVLHLTGYTTHVTITFNNPIDLKDKDWTLEWSSYNIGNHSNYYNELLLSPNGVTGTGVWARYGDNGYGNRLQFGTNYVTQSDVYSAPLTKSQLANQLSKYAMVCIDGQINVYCNGIKQILGRGAGGAYTNETFPVSTDLSELNQIKFGLVKSDVRCIPQYKGRIRLSLGARYLSNYTPPVF